MKDFKIIFTTILTVLLIIIAVIINLKTESPELSNKRLIEYFTYNTKLADTNSDHNQTLDVAEFATENGIEIPPILINFDTHSDLYLNYPFMKYEPAGIENWINEYIAKYPQVKEIYWVMPKEEAFNPLMQIFFADDDYKDIRLGTALYGNSLNKKIKPTTFIFKNLNKKAYTQEFLIDTKTGNLNEYIPKLKINKILFPKNKSYKKIKITTCTEKTLPDFKGKKVFLSIDADYISNSGFDTLGYFQIIKDDYGIEKSFQSIFQTLKSKNIQPEIISLTLSPEYLPKRHHQQVLQKFEDILDIANLEDIIQTYTRKRPTTKNHLMKTQEKYNDLF